MLVTSIPAISRIFAERPEGCAVRKSVRNALIAAVFACLEAGNAGEDELFRLLSRLDALA